MGPERATPSRPERVRRNCRGGLYAFLPQRPQDEILVVFRSSFGCVVRGPFGSVADYYVLVGPVPASPVTATVVEMCGYKLKSFQNSQPPKSLSSTDSEMTVASASGDTLVFNAVRSALALALRP